MSKNFPQFVVIQRVKGFCKVDVFLEFSCFFYDSMDVSNLISGSSAFSKSTLYNWKFSVHILLKPSLKDFEYNLASMWNECNCGVVWTFFGVDRLWDWNFQLQIGTHQGHCQWVNNKGICLLPLQKLNPMLLQLLTFHNPWGSSGWSEALCAPGNLMGQVFR